MEIYWYTDNLRKKLENKEFLGANFDKKVVKNIVKRLKEIDSADTYAHLPIASGKHFLEDSRSKVFTLDLPGIGERRGDKRLACRPYGEYDSTRVETIRAVMILGIVNHQHKNII